VNTVGIWIPFLCTLVTAVCGVIGAVWTAKMTAKKTAQDTSQNAISDKFRNLSLADLLDTKTIDLIRRQGSFVTEGDISKKMLQELASPEFNELRRIMFMKREIVRSVKPKEKTPDEIERLKNFYQDDGLTSWLLDNRKQGMAVSILSNGFKNLRTTQPRNEASSGK
jgi:hypothetical protein